MFIIKYYLAISLLTALSIIWIDNVVITLLLAWISLSLAAVSAAYITKQPSIFRKRENGAIPWFIRWIFWPFFLGAQLYNIWARKNDTVPAFQKIDDQLYLACRLFPSDAAQLKAEGISSILDATAEFSGLNWTAENEHLDYLNIPVLDHQSPTHEQLHQALTWVREHLRLQRSIVIHCALGRGRSVWLMAAVLLNRYPDWSVDKVLAFINDKRQTARLNSSQKKALERAKEIWTEDKQPRAWIIANPVSGGGKWQQAKNEAIQLLSAHYKLEIRETTPETDADVLCEQAIKQNASVIVAAGGDGTVQQVAQVMVKHKTPACLGVLPMGTANALAHVLLGIESKLMPLSLACKAIVDGHVETMDTAICNDRVVLLVLGIGFEQQMIADADRNQKDAGGQFAYVSALWNAISRGEQQTLKVKFDDEPEQTLTTGSFVVANAAPSTTLLAQGGGEPSFQDGVLDVTWFDEQHADSQTMANLAELAIRVLSNKEQSSQTRVRHVQAKQLRIEGEHTLQYVVDGESLEADELDIKVLPESLCVFCRAGAEHLTRQAED